MKSSTENNMLGKMPGDNWQKFANLRLAYSFMFAHPGKKLNFMGNDFGSTANGTRSSPSTGICSAGNARKAARMFKALNHVLQVGTHALGTRPQLLRLNGSGAMTRTIPS